MQAPQRCGRERGPSPKGPALYAPYLSRRGAAHGTHTGAVSWPRPRARCTHKSGSLVRISRPRRGSLSLPIRRRIPERGQTAAMPTYGTAARGQSLHPPGRAQTPARRLSVTENSWEPPAIWEGRPAQPHRLTARRSHGRTRGRWNLNGWRISCSSESVAYFLLFSKKADPARCIHKTHKRTNACRVIQGRALSTILSV